MIVSTVDQEPRGAMGAKAASELNNVLQIIEGTTDLLENIWEGTSGSEKYLHMLRTSVARAATITAGLVENSGGVSGRIVLPPAAETAPVEVAAASEEPRRVMVVEDEPVTLGLFSETLERAGYEVTATASGFAALDLLLRSEGRFDLVLLDYAMPFMDGEETFRRMRAINPKLRIILTTGFVHQTNLQTMLAEGLSAYLRKPLPSEEVLAAVRAALPQVPEQATMRGAGIAAA